jgi:dCMP deaminase
MNALLQGGRHGIRMDGGTLYSTHVPCSLCSKMLINTGIVRVVAAVPYPDDFARQMLQQARLELVTMQTLGEREAAAAE